MAVLLYALAGPAAADDQAQAGTPYIDQLIDPQALQSGAFADVEEQPQPEGLRSFSTEYRHFQQDLDRAGKSYEDGLILHGRRETRDYGEFELLATTRYEQPLSGPGEDNTLGGRLTLRQYGFAATDNWLMDNSLGILRSDADPVLSSSYRINLPSTLVAGAKTWSRSERTQFRLSAGRIGTLGTGRIEDFDTTTGTLASAGLSQTLSRNWLATAQLIAVNDSTAVPDHESGAMALQYLSPDQRHRYVGHALLDSEGNNGIWLDADDQLGRWRHRYGIFRMEPELLWSDAPVTDDLQGLYTRSELRSPRYNLTLGTDFNENNVDGRADRPRSRTSSVFVTGNRRLRRFLSLGGTASFNRVAPRNDLAAPRSQVVRLSTYAQQRFGFGTSRLELFVADVEEGGGSGDVYGAIWDQSWDFSRVLALSTTLSHARSDGVRNDEQRDSASLLFSHAITPDLDWNGSATYTRIRMADRPVTNNYNALLGARWHFQRYWDARLDLTWTRAGEPVALLDEVFGGDEKTLLLSIRHSVRGGRPFIATGNRGESSGYGEVSGAVFYDTNRDGQRQAGERAASGVFVYLDGRYERVTDDQGRFTFTTVPVGEHALTLAVEDLPLPWGLEDERPRVVTVRVREGSVVDFALTRINE